MYETPRNMKDIRKPNRVSRFFSSSTNTKMNCNTCNISRSNIERRINYISNYLVVELLKYAKENDIFRYALYV